MYLKGIRIMRFTSNEEIKKSLLKRAIGHNLLSLIAQLIALLVLIIMKNKGDVVVLIILTVFQYLLIVEIILIIIDSANLLYSYFCYKKGTPSIGKLLRFSKTMPGKTDIKCLSRLLRNFILYHT